MSELPTWEGFLAPVLGVLRDGSTRSAREVRTAVADLVGLSEDQRAELLNSGKPRFENRIGWALSFLTRAEALERPKRGRYVITGTGQRLLRENPDGLTEENLKAIPAYMAYQPKPRATSAPNGSVPAAESGDESALDPREQMEQGVARVHTEVAGQLLKRLRDGDPEFLEQAVLDVLVAMGYGGVEERARRLGGSGDGGVDGVIDQDPLGLARIYVQAKRYADGQVIGRPAIQGFVGALPRASGVARRVHHDEPVLERSPPVCRERQLEHHPHRWRASYRPDDSLCSRRADGRHLHHRRTGRGLLRVGLGFARSGLCG